MKKIYLTILITGLLNSFHCNAQISFTDGYYITNSNEKIDCLINNVDWQYNPSEFEYKLSATDEAQVMTINNVKEFGITNFSKYIRANVNIDRSSSKLNQLSNDRNPIFKKEQLFLKTLIDGDASLFVFHDKSLIRYFYKTPTVAIEQLIFKEFKNNNNQAGKNNEFRRQLNDNLKCADIKMNDLAYLQYKKRELLKLFELYNNCKNSTVVNYEQIKETKNFNLNLRVGLRSSSLTLTNSLSSSLATDYGSRTSLQFGAEAEFILGFNRNKWAVIVEPTYQYFKADGPENVNNGDADYKSIEIPVGIRHYMFLNETSKLFVNTSLVYDLPINSTVRNLDVSSEINLALGLGYNYKSTYSVELRYQTFRNILGGFKTWGSKYKTVSIVFGFSVL